MVLTGYQNLTSVHILNRVVRTMVAKFHFQVLAPGKAPVADAQTNTKDWNTTVKKLTNCSNCVIARLRIARTIG